MFKIKYLAWYRSPSTTLKGRTWRGRLYWIVKGDFSMTPYKRGATMFDSYKEAESYLPDYDGSSILDERSGVSRKIIWPWQIGDA